jgi:hypothetical protein
MIPDSLFDLLDLDHDGKVSRSELHTAATQLGWHWYEAPILALLDLLTLRQPIPRKQFTAIVQQIQNDPRGPYGEVLLNSAHFSKKSPGAVDQLSSCPSARLDGASNPMRRQSQQGEIEKNPVAAIEKTSGLAIATGYQNLLDSFDTNKISADAAALLIIDPQRSFTEGVWRQSIGDGAALDVEPIVIAFKNCSEILNYLYGRMEIMFTRCPFPPGSYDWDERLAPIIADRQLYFIKPGNSVLLPPLNGFKQWVQWCLENGKNTLILGGCTLNSCVRVSSIDTLTCFKDTGLNVVVDLSLCGARLRNYSPSAIYQGISAVESAVRQMAIAGVQVVRRVEWC